MSILGLTIPIFFFSVSLPNFYEQTANTVYLRGTLAMNQVNQVKVNDQIKTEELTFFYAGEAMIHRCKSSTQLLWFHDCATLIEVA